MSNGSPVSAAASMASNARATWSASNSERSMLSGWAAGSSGRTFARDCDPGAQNSSTSLPRVAQQRQDELDAAVSRRRNGDPGRREHRDAQRSVGRLHLALGARRRLLHDVVRSPPGALRRPRRGRPLPGRRRRGACPPWI
jgi:hypothetical protein